jgi:DNA-binding beta-propeller fold protein YncE
VGKEWDGFNQGFTYPSGVAVDAQGNIYVLDSLRGRILKLSPPGEVLAVWRIPGSTLLRGIALDTREKVYVTGNTGQLGYHGVVYKLSPVGKVLAVWK